MSQETKINSGAIFKNEKKKEEKHPDYQGKINVDGVDKDISLWLKEAKSGIKYFSVSIRPPYVKDGSNSVQNGSSSNQSSSKINSEDDLPF